MMLRHLGSNRVHLSSLVYPTSTAHFITDYQTPRAQRPQARCGVILNNRRHDVVVMQADSRVTCPICKRIGGR